MGLPHGQVRALEVDVDPPEPDRLATAQARRGQQVPQRVEPVVLDTLEWCFRGREAEDQAGAGDVKPSDRMRELGIVQEGDPILRQVATPFDLPAEAEDARRLVAHEIDHLDGRLYLDRLANNEAAIPVERYSGTGGAWSYRNG